MAVVGLVAVLSRSSPSWLATFTHTTLQVDAVAVWQAVHRQALADV